MHFSMKKKKRFLAFLFNNKNQPERQAIEKKQQQNQSGVWRLRGVGNEGQNQGTESRGQGQLFPPKMFVRVPGKCNRQGSGLICSRFKKQTAPSALDGNKRAFVVQKTTRNQSQKMQQIETHCNERHIWPRMASQSRPPAHENYKRNGAGRSRAASLSSEATPIHHRQTVAHHSHSSAGIWELGF